MAQSILFQQTSCDQFSLLHQAFIAIENRSALVGTRAVDRLVDVVRLICGADVGPPSRFADVARGGLMIIREV